jgi:hypothetical protein
LITISRCELYRLHPNDINIPKSNPAVRCGSVDLLECRTDPFQPTTKLFPTGIGDRSQEQRVSRECYAPLSTLRFKDVPHWSGCGAHSLNQVSDLRWDTGWKLVCPELSPIIRVVSTYHVLKLCGRFRIDPQDGRKLELHSYFCQRVRAIHFSLRFWEWHSTLIIGTRGQLGPSRSIVGPLGAEYRHETRGVNAESPIKSQPPDRFLTTLSLPAALAGWLHGAVGACGPRLTIDGDMNLSTPLIRRPVATTLLTAAVALAGAVAFRALRSRRGQRRPSPDRGQGSPARGPAPTGP